MAVDEAIFMSVIDGDGSPTLRFYDWRPSCISLGYFQKSSVVNIGNCKKLAIDVVRRPTGGRAVLHEDEITYSIVLPIPLGREGNIPATFRMINQGIISGLSRVGIRSSFHKGTPKAHRSPLCFSSPSKYEVLAGGKKIIGSAQVRRKGILLQQGSLPLNVNREKIISAMNLTSLGETKCFSKSSGLNEFLGSSVSREVLISMILEGFRESLAMKFVVGSLTDNEMETAKFLQSGKYTCDSWTFKW